MVQKNIKKLYCKIYSIMTLEEKTEFIRSYTGWWNFDITAKYKVNKSNPISNMFLEELGTKQVYLLMNLVINEENKSLKIFDTLSPEPTKPFLEINQNLLSNINGIFCTSIQLDALDIKCGCMYYLIQKKG